ncbi:MAG: tetratricopeptide repeat protein, partial [Planctomycetota bacterium]
TSRVARLKRAEWAEARRDYTEADALLVELLNENAGDVEAIELRMDVLRRSDREDEATELIEAKLAELPESLPVLQLAQQHYSTTQQRDKFLETTERLLERLPPSPQRAEGLASVYLSRGRLDDAERVVREAMAAHGEVDDPGLALMLALILQRQGDMPGSVAIKQRILEANPDHAPTANDLAYHYAVRGESLDEALRLATIAATAEPGNSAYVDTLGWVYYKLGRFDEAAAELGRSLALARQEERRGLGDRSETRAVVSDHLGDAMYRLGRAEQAERYWEMSLRLAPDGPGIFDPDLNGLKDRLAAKLAALEAAEPAPVADVPGFPIEAPRPAEALPDLPVEPVP